MKKQTLKQLTLRGETLRNMANIELTRARGGADGGRIDNTVQICVDTDAATNCLCGGHTNDCHLDTFGCQGPTLTC